MPRIPTPISSRQFCVEMVLPEDSLDGADLLQLGDDAVALRVHVGPDMVRHLPRRVAEADPLIERRRAEPHRVPLHELIPSPVSHVMPLARAVADRLLEGEVL